MQRVIIGMLMLAALAANSMSLAQSSIQLNGVVTNSNGKPIGGAHIFLLETKQRAITNSKGIFSIDIKQKGTYQVNISYVGYKCIHGCAVTASSTSQTHSFVMEPESYDLSEVTVVGHRAGERRKEVSAPVEYADRALISKNLGSSLMKSLETLPGISSMEIGQGFSKPVIRGLGFNRVAVSENGVKMEGQQWGADHGLEIDQLGVENVEVIKGPASLEHGSDAVSGAIIVKPIAIAPTNTVETSVTAIAKSANELFGLSAMAKARTTSLFAYTRFTQTQFGDYRVPADSFFFNRYRLPIYNGRLKNTAGTEKNFYLTTGIIKEWGKISVSASSVSSKVGFFAGSHGIPSANKLLPDGNTRNIGLPYQEVNHLKLSVNGNFFSQIGKVAVDIGYQNNHRQEHSLFHTHYPTQEPPKTSPNLELLFRLQTLSANIAVTRKISSARVSYGLSGLSQTNGIGGYTFLLPKYEKTGLGAFAVATKSINSKVSLNAGIRYDIGSISIKEYVSPYNGTTRAPKFTGMYHDISWGAGITYAPTSTFSLKGNIGKSFRMPSANELSANGIHHGSFRFEVGSTSITSEYAYQADIGIQFTSTLFEIGASPFVSYFPNFIFLNPTGGYTHPDGSEITEADAGQVYQYTQSKALRYGGEVTAKVQMGKNLHLKANGEMVFATDFTYPLPFTPPIQSHVELEFSIPYYWKKLHRITVSIQSDIVAPQNRNSRNELGTSGYALLDIHTSTIIITRLAPISVSLQIQNLLNKKYWNHMNFYRSIEIPEVGRNIVVSASIPISKKFENEAKE
ncbi:MAG: TonB-dependent receptor [Bacteroidales bacterium]|nr:TonB-dependent receptor [Bacteroidales bacterium]MBN2748380.1 TonB-dependent receptor [Bacteroidales bacterium]